MKTTYYIVPALTDVAGQCRIMSCDASLKEIASEARSVREHYRKYPRQWREVGLMNSQGRVVALDAPPYIYAEFKYDEPLSAGMTYELDADLRKVTA